MDQHGTYARYVILDASLLANGPDTLTLTNIKTEDKRLGTRRVSADVSGGSGAQSYPERYTNGRGTTNAEAVRSSQCRQRLGTSLTDIEPASQRLARRLGMRDALALIAIVITAVSFTQIVGLVWDKAPWLQRIDLRTEVTLHGFGVHRPTSSGLRTTSPTRAAS